MPRRGGGGGGRPDARPLRFEARFDGSDATGHLVELSPARQTARPDSAPSFGLCAITEQTRAPRVFEGCLRGKGNKTKKRGVARKARGNSSRGDLAINAQLLLVKAALRPKNGR